MKLKLDNKHYMMFAISVVCFNILFNAIYTKSLLDFSYLAIVGFLLLRIYIIQRSN